MNDNEYKCELCKGVFEKDQTEEEARAEEKEMFGGNDPDAALVCDDCYKEMFPWMADE